MFVDAISRGYEEKRQRADCRTTLPRPGGTKEMSERVRRGTCVVRESVKKSVELSVVARSETLKSLN